MFLFYTPFYNPFTILCLPFYFLPPNLWFSGAIREYKVEKLARYGLTHISPGLYFMQKRVTWFALQIKTGFYMKCNPGLKWVKKTFYITKTASTIQKSLAEIVCHCFEVM